MLSSQQFQPTLPGMEGWAAKPEQPRVLTPPNANKPVGMRGSMVDRLRSPERHSKMLQQRGRWESMRGRVDDEGYDGWGDDEEEEALTHPRTGLPIHGEIDTAHIGLGQEGHIDANVSYHGSTSFARRSASTVREIPIASAGYKALHTVQRTVSSHRVHEAMEDPSTTASPRFPGALKELPYVYENNPGKHTVIDGNHRMSAAVMRGEMFQPARVITRQDVPKIMDITHNAKERRKRVAEADPEREARSRLALEDRYYG